MSMVCRNCHRTSVLTDIFEMELSDHSGMVTLETFLCRNCKEAFEWGTAVCSDNDEAEFNQLTGKYTERHELDEWHAYRNALAAALAGVAGESRQACTSAANAVIDRRLLPPDGEVRNTYRDCGLFAVMYVIMEEEHPYHDVTTTKLPVDKFTEYLLHGDYDRVRHTHMYRKPEDKDGR